MSFTIIFNNMSLLFCTVGFTHCSDGIVPNESGVLKHRAEVELESTMALSRGSASTFSEVNIGLSAVTISSDFPCCPEWH